VPTDKPTNTGLSSWRRRRRRWDPSRSPSALWRTTGASWRSGVARNCLTAQAHAIQQLGLRTQIGLYVAQRLAASQLSKSDGQELVHAGEIFNLVIASVLGNAAAKRAPRQERHELRKNKFAFAHCGPMRANAKDHKSWNRSSNRDPSKITKTQCKSLTYEVLIRKRWDTAESP